MVSIEVMLAVALAIVVVPLVWFFLTRGKPVDPAVRRVAVACLVAGIGAALAVRSGPAAIAFVAGVALLVWLRLRGRGGDDGGDDGHDPPDDPGPDPGSGDQLDPDAFDRARARWEQELRERS